MTGTCNTNVAPSEQIGVKLEIKRLMVDMPGLREMRLILLHLGTPIGTASVQNSGEDAATIYQLFVLEEYRGCGMGSKLVKWACDWCQVSGSLAISAMIEPGGPMEFYTKLGFAPVHIENGRTLVSKRLRED